MLLFEGNKIIFNKEVGVGARYNLTDFPFAHNERLKEFLPNCEIYKIVKASQIKDSGQIFGMKLGKQFLAFVTSWMVNCMENTDLYLSEDEAWGWIYSYYVTVRRYNFYFQDDYMRDTLFFPELEINLPDREVWEDTKLTKSPIIIDYPVKPEISWAIVDCWKRMVNGEEYLPFEDQVNAYIKDNIKRLQDKKKKINSYNAIKLFQPRIHLDSSFTIRDLDYTEKQAFFYFYCPICEDLVRSNIVYLDSMWRKYQPELALLK